jgi:hypothetical protein
MAQPGTVGGGPAVHRLSRPSSAVAQRRPIGLSLNHLPPRLRVLPSMNHPLRRRSPTSPSRRCAPASGGERCSLVATRSTPPASTTHRPVARVPRALNARVFANTCIIVGFVWLCTELRVMEEALKVFDYMPLRDAMWIVLWSVV